jgi:hypothetical protein
VVNASPHPTAAACLEARGTFCRCEAPQRDARKRAGISG